MSQTQEATPESGRTRREMIELLENLCADLRVGGPTFIALAVVTPSARDPTCPVVAVGKYGCGPLPRQVNQAFSGLASQAQDIGVLIPD